MLSELRVEDIWKSLDGHVDYLPWGFALAIEREATEEYKYLLRTCLARMKVKGIPMADIELEIRNLEIKEPK